ncbi:MAG: amidohydrolase family protein [Candidatus Lokiarchaeota archaeon]|nr:amidohydrolase family protein [Candidatus Lokiarchaeota archaeon]
MTHDKPKIGFFRVSGLLLFFFTVLVEVLAWITYASLQGVLGMLAYILVSLINIYPWIIPFVGIPLGILDILGIFGPQMYNITLNLAHLSSAWMPAAWYWIIAIISSIIDLIVSILIISWLIGLKNRKKEPKTDYALINCNIIDGQKDSTIISNGIILIKNLVGEEETPGLIEKVGGMDEVKIPDNYTKIDLNGNYILPGLINAHCHLTGSGKPMAILKLSDKWMERLVSFLATPIGRVILKRMMKKNALNALHAGVTTMKTMSDPLYMDLEVRDEINEGKFLGPRLLCAGKGICVTGGHGVAMAHIADSKVEIRKAVRRNLRERVDFIKILSTGGVMDARKVGEAGRPQMTIGEIETACIEGHRGNLLVATHCESSEGIEEALEGGVDSIEHGATIPEDCVPLFKNNPKSLRGFTYLVPTISAGMGLASLPKETTKITEESKQNAILIEEGMIKGLQKAYESGIRIGVGTDASVPYSLHYELWKELKYFTLYTGMSNQEAIYYGTKNNAELLGIDEITGSIEEGKFADLQVVKNNPLENIEALSEVKHVFIGGTFIKNPKVDEIEDLEKVEPIEL